MNKFIVTINKLKDIDIIKDKDIYGVIFSIKDLSVNSNYYIDIDELEKISSSFDKKIIVSLNKIMHESDIPMLKDVLIRLSNLKIDRVLFYDLSVLNIVESLNLDLNLVIFQDHLNSSINSNNFYYNNGIKGSYLTNDITLKEVIDIKNKTNMEIFFTVYGYLPIFYSRRYLLDSYFTYINKKKESNSYYISNDDNNYYKIEEESFGTTIYTKEPINLINEIELLKDIDYLVINSLYIDNIGIIIDMFNNNEKIKGTYTGFANISTIYKVKS